MADQNASAVLTPPTPEQRRVAAGQFERANQVLATNNHDYAIQLLLTCCKLDPANLIYRQALRRTEKIKYKNNLRGSRLAFLTTSRVKSKLKFAKSGREYLKVLEYGEEILAINPWDVGAQMDMAESADALQLLDVAVWILEQARQKDPEDATVNRALARLYEKRGNFRQAIALWELVRKAAPQDVEAQHKGKDLAVCDTIQRGGYEEAVRGELPAKAGGDSKDNLKPLPTPVQGRDAPPLSPNEERVEREAASLRARVEADPSNPHVYLQLAQFYRKADCLDEARRVLNEALVPTNNNFDVASELAELEIEPFRQNLALTEERIKLKPGDEELRKIRVRLLKEINTRELDFHRERAERYPTEMAHRCELGVRLLRAGQTDEAITALQAARTDPRHRWRALLYLGYCFKNRNNWRLAQRNFEEALQNLPPGEDDMKKELLFQLAQGCADAGDLAKAVELAYDLANLDFGYRDIGRLLDEWQAKLQHT